RESGHIGLVFSKIGGVYGWRGLWAAGHLPVPRPRKWAATEDAEEPAGTAAGLGHTAQRLAPRISFSTNLILALLTSPPIWLSSVLSSETALSHCAWNWVYAVRSSPSQFSRCRRERRSERFSSSMPEIWVIRVLACSRAA